LRFAGSGSDEVMSDEKAILVWSVLVLATGVGILVLSALFGPRRKRPTKMDPYECGVPIFQDARERFPIRFYLMAIVFILFDIEVVFILPWAMMYRQLGVAGLVEVLVFIAVLGAGYIYIWKRRVIDWE
jgi:NADH-quinone oxidoreductase subunit A